MVENMDRSSDLTITLRQATAADETEILALTRDLATSFTVEPAAFATAFSHVLAAADTYCTVAISGGTIVGYALGHVHPTLYATSHVATVEEIILRHDMRRAGIGKMLMDDFEIWARSKSCRLVSLATRRAADFYKRLGYEESATYFRKILQSG